MRVGLLCGSDGPRSANAALLDVAAARVVATGHAVIRIPSPAMMPPLRADQVDDPPEPVGRFRALIRGTDALLIAAPEYAAGVAGATKNALDWLVGDATLDRKVVGVASAGTTGGGHAIEQLVRTISWQGGYVVATLGIAAPRTKSDADGVIVDADTRDEIVRWCDVTLGAATGDADQRASLVTSVVSGYGIDPARFGTIS